MLKCTLIFTARGNSIGVKLLVFQNVPANSYTFSSKGAVDSTIAAGKVCILDIDMQGAELVRNSFGDVFCTILLQVANQYFAGPRNEFRPQIRFH